ncbi:hypothetical protein ABN028_06040 [Actinopolymorpha sp. B17G11]|uniref:hypothetical protein n=1 Tax=unclassified Actinopolymorpha TaxID=2627063 RepID=UPI0032D904FD
MSGTRHHQPHRFSGEKHAPDSRPTQERCCYPWSPVFPSDWQGHRVVLKHAAQRNGEAVQRGAGT